MILLLNNRALMLLGLVGTVLNFIDGFHRSSQYFRQFDHSNWIAHFKFEDPPFRECGRATVQQLSGSPFTKYDARSLDIYGINAFVIVASTRRQRGQLFGTSMRGALGDRSRERRDVLVKSSSKVVAVLKSIVSFIQRLLIKVWKIASVIRRIFNPPRDGDAMMKFIVAQSKASVKKGLLKNEAASSEATDPAGNDDDLYAAVQSKGSEKEVAVDVKYREMDKASRDRKYVETRLRDIDSMMRRTEEKNASGSKKYWPPGSANATGQSSLIARAAASTAAAATAVKRKPVPAAAKTFTAASQRVYWPPGIQSRSSVERAIELKKQMISSSQRAPKVSAVASAVKSSPATAATIAASKSAAEIKEVQHEYQINELPQISDDALETEQLPISGVSSTTTATISPTAQSESLLSKNPLAALLARGLLSSNNNNNNNSSAIAAANAEEQPEIIDREFFVGNWRLAELRFNGSDKNLRNREFNMFDDIKIPPYGPVVSKLNGSTGLEWKYIAPLATGAATVSVGEQQQQLQQQKPVLFEMKVLRGCSSTKWNRAFGGALTAAVVRPPRQQQYDQLPVTVVYRGKVIGCRIIGDVFTVRPRSQRSSSDTTTGMISDAASDIDTRTAASVAAEEGAQMTAAGEETKVGIFQIYKRAV